MSTHFDPRANYENTKNQAGYVDRKKATQADYDRIGFMSGLEVHQQIKTEKKLFCHCPACKFNKFDNYHAELIRHMRPTLSELGEYDGTALMEFKTRKEIVYRINNATACTYDIDDTPPFPINREALEKAIKIALRSNLNIVGEVHITRKQYLDGSIPTGFQRTAIIGVEGLLKMPKKDIRLIQLSIEEDACREISDIGHRRVYQTDRLGVPLIETVTYPDCTNPDELRDAASFIRFLGRSTGLVRTGMGAGREDVNVSCTGGTRIEIKGVSHIKWIPELSHNEAFRQWSLLLLRDRLNSIADKDNWHIVAADVHDDDFSFKFEPIVESQKAGGALKIIKLPKFRAALSHFTQPGKIFADEIADRLKVIACLERPNMLHDEMLEPVLSKNMWKELGEVVQAGDEDALILLWGPRDDMKTALEVIEERCLMAFDGIPKETRKSFENGTTIFERVLPGADRMYPDTDSAPIPLDLDWVESLKKDLPTEIIDQYYKLKEWDVPEDCFTYILSRNYFPVMLKINEELGVNGKLLGTFFGHRIKYIMGQHPKAQLTDEQIYNMFAYLKENNLNYRLAWKMLPFMALHPKTRPAKVIEAIHFRKVSESEITKKISRIKEDFVPVKKKNQEENLRNWIMGQIHDEAVGNVDLAEISKTI
ncbi:MAG TPA: Glu-tRNA(Gln) amidotransferase subunit GatE [Bacteroidetes bacterium]|nr:Glu-tRNA(Gln) amidotransferase subunit GatE [Candidatus Limimorpha avicola]